MRTPLNFLEPVINITLVLNGGLATLDWTQLWGKTGHIKTNSEYKYLL